MTYVEFEKKHDGLMRRFYEIAADIIMKREGSLKPKLYEVQKEIKHLQKTYPDHYENLKDSTT